MPSYRIIVQPGAARQIAKLPTQILVRIDQALERLSKDPRPPGSQKLAGPTDLYRIRVGDHRIIYEIRDQLLIITVVKVGHRRDVYR